MVDFVETYRGRDISVDLDGSYLYEKLNRRGKVVDSGSGYTTLQDARDMIDEMIEAEYDAMQQEAHDMPRDYPQDQLDYEWNQPGAPFRSSDY